MKEFFDAVSSYGFAVVVAGFLLLRTEATLGKLSESIVKLIETIDDLKLEVRMKGKK